MNRAAARRRGKRKEAERKARNALVASQQRMWKRSTRTDIIPVGYQGTDEIDAGSFYCPYVPVLRPTSFIPGDTTA